MRTSKFTLGQIQAILAEAETDISKKDLCRKYDISDTCFYKWKAKYGEEARSLAPVVEIRVEMLQLHLTSNWKTRGVGEVCRNARRSPAMLLQSGRA